MRTVPPPPATRSLAHVLRSALAQGDAVRLIVATGLVDGGGINTAAYMRVEIEGEPLVIPKLAGVGLGGSRSGYPVYILATRRLMLAIGTVG